MKKYSLVLLVLLTGLTQTSVFSDENVDQGEELLQVLIENAATLEVKDLDMPENSGKILPQLLAQALANNIYLKTGATAFLVSVNGSCKVKNPGSVGAVNEECILSISNGDYIKTESGYEGPEAESGISILFNTSKVVYPGAKANISNVRVQRAG